MGRAVLVLVGLGLLATPVASEAAGVTITDATDEGLACFKIVTDNATYFYDKAGAGFTSMLDKDGNDWIGFHPQGTSGVPNGQSGWYRGIPNMGLNKFGHPGYTGATSTTSDAKGATLSKATVKSTKGKWSVTWEFFPTHAKLTINAVEENYWLLYEGTPGGAVGSNDTCWRSSGQSNSCSSSWEGDVTNTSGAATSHEWVYFADGTLSRSIFLVHDDDTITDRYYLMDPMTVFGFGRQAANTNRLLSKVPATLYIGFAESKVYATVKGVIDKVVTGGTVTPATRTDVDAAIRDRAAGKKTDAEVKAQIKSYRTQ
jgi:hypothetical protein